MGRAGENYKAHYHVEQTDQAALPPAWKARVDAMKGRWATAVGWRVHCLRSQDTTLVLRFHCLRGVDTAFA